MQKPITALLISLLASVSLGAYAQQDKWQKIIVGDSVTVEFPGVPEQKETETKLGKAQAYTLTDGRALYMAIVQSHALEEESNDSEIAEFYSGVLKGSGGQVLKKTSFSTNGFSGVEAQFITPENPQLPAVKFLRVVAVNGTAYIQQVWTSDEQNEAVAPERQRFFASFQPKVAKVDQAGEGVQTNTSAYRLGKLLGRLAFYAVVAFVGFVLLRRFLKWSDKPKSVS